MRLNRYVASTPPGIVITAGLLLLMQQLIASGEQALVSTGQIPPAFVLKTVDLPPVLKQQIDDPPPSRIDKPRPAPTTETVHVRTAETSAGPGLPRIGPALPPTKTPSSLPAWSDSPLVSMVRVEPQYPLRAKADGREGFVIVKFDVAADGSVIEPVVVESSHSVFERPALRAVERFRYKPRVVDGLAQATSNVQTMFRFTLKDKQ